MSEHPQFTAPTTLLLEDEPLLAWLVSLNDATWGQLIPIPWEGLTLGAGPMNDLRLSDPLASPMHARIQVVFEQDQPRCQLQDLASTYGSFVNDVRIVRHHLADNDVIRLGQSQFCYKQLYSNSSVPQT